MSRYVTLRCVVLCHVCTALWCNAMQCKCKVVDTRHCRTAQKCIKYDEFMIHRDCSQNRHNVVSLFNPGLEHLFILTMLVQFLVLMPVGFWWILTLCISRFIRSTGYLVNAIASQVWTKKLANVCLGWMTVIEWEEWIRVLLIAVFRENCIIWFCSYFMLFCNARWPKVHFSMKKTENENESKHEHITKIIENLKAIQNLKLILEDLIFYRSDALGSLGRWKTIEAETNETVSMQDIRVKVQENRFASFSTAVNIER